jgi:hypothetical protein
MRHRIEGRWALRQFSEMAREAHRGSADNLRGLLRRLPAENSG